MTTEFRSWDGSLVARHADDVAELAVREAVATIIDRHEWSRLHGGSIGEQLADALLEAGLLVTANRPDAQALADVLATDLEGRLRAENAALRHELRNLRKDPAA